MQLASSAIPSTTMIGALLLTVGAANIRQPYPDLAPLQHVPTVLLLSPPRLGCYGGAASSTGAVALVWSFLLLRHAGGRYIYSRVPHR